MNDDAAMGMFLKALLDVGGTSQLLPEVPDLNPEETLAVADRAERLGYVTGRASRNAADNLFALLNCTITTAGRSFVAALEEQPNSIANSEDVPFFDRVGLSDNLRRIVARTAQEFDSTGDWVTYDVLVYENAEGEGRFDIKEIFQLPASIGGVASPEERVSLTGLGLILSEAAPESVQTMVQLVHISVERKLRLRDQAKLGREILVSEYGFPMDKAIRAMNIFQLIPGISGGGQLGDDWELSIFRTALTDYQGVTTVQDLRSVLERQAVERLRLQKEALASAPGFIATNVFAESFQPRPPGVSTIDETSVDRIVFLSWSGSASRAVTALFHGVLQRRLPRREVFFSPVSIDPGEDPMLEIFERNLLRAQTLVALLTEQALNSSWVIWEIASAWALKELVVPIFVDVSPGDVPGPMTLKVQGVRLANRDELDRAIGTVMKQAGFIELSPLTDDEWQSLCAASLTREVEPVFPASFSQRVVPLNDGDHTGSLLAILLKADDFLEGCKCMLTSITGPPGAEVIPVPAILPWHPTREPTLDVARDAVELICIARVGPVPPSAVIDSYGQAVPWGLGEGAWRLELQLTAKGRIAQLVDVAFTITPTPGIPNQLIDWTELTVH